MRQLPPAGLPTCAPARRRPAPVPARPNPSGAAGRLPPSGPHLELHGICYQSSSLNYLFLFTLLLLYVNGCSAQSLALATILYGNWLPYVNDRRIVSQCEPTQNVISHIGTLF